MVRLIDFDDPAANDWLAVNQFTVIEAGHNRRPDIVVFINGLPLSIIELKNAADEEATIWNAYEQLKTYTAEIPSLLHYSELLVVSDGSQARIGSLTANQEWFKVWRTIVVEKHEPKLALEYQTRSLAAIGPLLTAESPQLGVTTPETWLRNAGAFLSSQPKAKLGEMARWVDFSVAAEAAKLAP
jgi:type I site-specific restriction-modification system R (restriction) subunit